MVSLILVSGGDIASTNQAHELLKMCDWKELDPVEGRSAYSYNCLLYTSDAADEL